MTTANQGRCEFKLETEKPLRPGPRLPQLLSNRRQTGGLKMGKSAFIIVAGVAGVLVVGVAIILSLTFTTLNFNELGFKKRKTTAQIDRSQVYGPGGRYALGPDYSFRTFQADAHFVGFSGVTVFASDKLQVSISANMQYFLRKDQMGLLHKKYDIRYEPIIKNNAQDALKNHATKFSTREFIRDRLRVETSLFEAVRERLSGTCCERGCKETDSCTVGCKKRSSCDEDDYGFFVDVRFFQLDILTIPRDLEAKFLKGLTLKEESETEHYKQEAQIVRKETGAKIKQIQNEAHEIRQTATARSTLVRSLAQANATSIVEEARSTGLKHLYTELVIDTNEHKASFDYLRTLRGHTGIHIAVDYQQLIAGPLK